MDYAIIIQITIEKFCYAELKGVISTGRRTVCSMLKLFLISDAVSMFVFLLFVLASLIRGSLQQAVKVHP